MNHNTRITTFLFLTIICIQISCSKKDSTDPPTDLCANKTIVLSAATTAGITCGAGASISATASGSSGFMFKLNADGTYQSSPVFTDVAAGDYTLFAKDKDGCTQSIAVTVTSTGTAGPLFSAVKTLMAAKCQSCHNNSVQNGGMNWQDQCNIIANKTRINERAVVIGDMPKNGPELSQDEKNIITNWINAGGKFTD